MNNTKQNPNIVDVTNISLDNFEIDYVLDDILNSKTAQDQVENQIAVLDDFIKEDNTRTAVAMFAAGIAYSAKQQAEKLNKPRRHSKHTKDT